MKERKKRIDKKKKQIKREKETSKDAHKNYNVTATCYCASRRVEETNC